MLTRASFKQCPVMVFLPVLFGLLVSTASHAFAASGGEAVAAPVAARQLNQWHETLRNFKPIQPGCFHATYPSLAWVQESCGQFPEHRPIPPGPVGPSSSASSPPLRQTGSAATIGTTKSSSAASGSGAPQGAGDGADYIAITSNLTSSAIGSFPVVSGVTSASSSNYSLQINTNASPGPAAFCTSHGYASCYTWEQFIYATTGEQTSGTPAQAYIQNWLFIPPGNACPGGWIANGTYLLGGSQYNGCFKDSNPVNTDLVALSGLASVKLSGSASPTGNDTVMFTHGTTVKAVSESGGTLDIGATWNQTEFNVVGDGSILPVASFNSGSSLTVNLQVNDGTSNTPVCAGGGTTAESNNLNLGPCTANGGSAPAIQFTETAPQNGMTWSAIAEVDHVGYDSVTNPYSGDTPITTALPILCINVTNLPTPAGINIDSYDGWAKGFIEITQPIAGTQLTSRAAADQACASYMGGNSQWRMAEFHDGGSGWSYWAEAYGDNLSNTRFWVAINDQPANPWNTTTGRAMTWTARPPATSSIVHVGSDGVTNPYSGDTPPSSVLSVLCFQPGAISAPTGITFATFDAWSSGKVGLTSPVAGTQLTSRATADNLCATQLGTGWRMAEFHDAGGWKLWGLGDTTPWAGSTSPGRFWVAINDQPANPWGM